MLTGMVVKSTQKEPGIRNRNGAVKRVQAGRQASGKWTCIDIVLFLLTLT